MRWRLVYTSQFASLPDRSSKAGRCGLGFQTKRVGNRCYRGAQVVGTVKLLWAHFLPTASRSLSVQSRRAHFLSIASGSLFPDRVESSLVRRDHLLSQSGMTSDSLLLELLIQTRVWHSSNENSYLYRQCSQRQSVTGGVSRSSD